MAVKMDNISWSIYNGALVPDVPPHIKIELSRKQAGYLLKKSKAYMLRWTSEFDCGFETQWWHMVRDKAISLDEFDSKRRWELKKALKRCEVRKVDAEFVARNGYEVYKAAFDSYDTFQKPAGRQEFFGRMMSRKDDRVFEFWSVFSRADGRMTGYFMNRVGFGCCQYSVGKPHPDFLKEGILLAAVYEMTNHYLNEMGLKYVCAGARCISHKTNIQEFLISKLHFRKAFCRLNVVYNPIIKIIVNILYPFRNTISKINTNVTNKITVLLRQETIWRSFNGRQQ